jgi:hypothetical protein
MAGDRIDIVDAAFAEGAGSGAPEQFGVFNVEPDRDLGCAPELCSERSELACLCNVAWEAVEHVTAARQCFIKRGAQHLQHQVVWHQVAGREVVSDPLSELSAGRHLRTEQLT